MRQPAVDIVVERVVADFPHLAVVHVHAVLFFQRERPGANAAEHGDLAARFVHGPVAVHALRQAAVIGLAPILEQADPAEQDRRPADRADPLVDRSTLRPSPKKRN